MAEYLEWIRLYVDTPNDPKIKRLTIHERWIWICLLCLASKSPVRGQLLLAEGIPLQTGDIVEQVSMTDDDCPEDIWPTNDIPIGGAIGMCVYRTIELAIEKFQKLKMVHMEGEVIVLTNFEKRQHVKPSDEPERVAERVKKHRKLLGDIVTPPCNAPPMALRNATDTDTEKIQIRKDNTKEPASGIFLTNNHKPKSQRRDLENLHAFLIKFDGRECWPLAQKLLNEWGLPALKCAIKKYEMKLGEFHAKGEAIKDGRALFLDILNPGKMAQYFTPQEEKDGWYPNKIKERTAGL